MVTTCDDKMKQSDAKNTTTSNQSAAMPLPQPVSILRRSTSAGGAPKKKKNNPGAASFSQSTNMIDAEYDAPARSRRPSDDSFRGGDVNHKHRDRDSLDSGNSNFTPITDPNELADRILHFQRSYASSLSAADNNINDGKNSPPPMRGGQRYRPPPPPPRSTSSGKKRNKAMNSSANDIDHPKYCDKADKEHDYVRRMERITLDSQFDSPQFSASSSDYAPTSDTLRRTRMNDSARSSPPPPPTLPFAAKKKNGELNRNLNESSVSANSNKFNSSSTTVTSSKESFVPRPVRVSQFEDKWEVQQNQNGDTSTPPTKPKMTMASSLSTSSQVAKNLETSPSQPVVSSTPKNCDKRGRCKYHPQHKLYKKKLLGGYEFISTCPICDAKLEAKNRAGSGDNNFNTASAKNPSRTIAGRGRSRSRERRRSNSIDQVPIESKLDEDDTNFNALKVSPGRTRRRRSKSVEQQQQHLSDRGERRQRRPRSRRVDRDNDLHGSSGSNSFGKSLTTTLESIRDKLPSHPPPPPLRQQRSRSREGRRLLDQSTDVGTSLGNDLRAIDKGKGGSSRDITSTPSYDGTDIRKKKNLGNNQFVHQDSEMNFDKKTGRCKKHPSVVLAKKSKFRSGSWEIIKQNGCPLCAKGGGAPVRDEIGQDIDEDTKRKMDMLLRGSQDTSGEASPQLSKNVETRSGNSTTPNQSIIDKIPAEGLRGNKVSRMLYTTPMGETGWYTGEVDFERNPHGHGRMRYKTGHSYEGQWIHGYGEVHLENLNRMKSGFGTNKAAWNQSELAPSVRKAAPDASKSLSSRSAVHQYQQQSSNQSYISAQMQHAQQQQYAQMHQQQQYAQMQQQQQMQQAQMQQAWANMSPEERQMAMTQWYASAGIPSQPGYQMQGYPPI